MNQKLCEALGRYYENIDNETLVDLVVQRLAKLERALNIERANKESWRRAHNSWQDWATELLHDLGLQPKGGECGDGPAREMIGQLARLGNMKGKRV